MDNLATLLAPLPPRIGELTRQLVALLAGHPGVEGRVMTGWKSINFRHRQAGYICGVFPNAERVALYFEHGRLLSAEDELPLGRDLKRGRYTIFRPGDDIPIDTIGVLVTEAIALFS
ncbi:MAG: DUF1801 domain-containing protein [Devosia sp.]